jgi:hypothetical protein
MVRVPRALRVLVAAVLAIPVVGAAGVSPAAAEPGFCGWNPAVVGIRPGEEPASFLSTYPEPWQTSVEIAFNGVFNPVFTQPISVTTGTITFDYQDERDLLRQGLGDPAATTGAVTYRYLSDVGGPPACEITVVLWEESPPSTSSTIAPTTSTTVPDAAVVTPRDTG